MKKKVKKIRRYPNYDLVDIPSHMIDSIWTKKDGTELKIVFATGQVADFRPLYVD